VRLRRVCETRGPSPPLWLFVWLFQRLSTVWLFGWGLCDNGGASKMGCGTWQSEHNCICSSRSGAHIWQGSCQWLGRCIQASAHTSLPLSAKTCCAEPSTGGSVTLPQVHNAFEVGFKKQL
jgi:hypothetical protein